MERGKLVVIVAPSGTGKSTLIKKLIDATPELEWSVSCTTRPQREGEREGIDYCFLTESEFLSKRERGEFIEWAQVHSNYYGTLKSFVDRGLEQGKKLLFDLDVQGCDQMKKLYGEEAKVV
ncbi:MAG: guanylate kinase, partial [Bacteriovoracaceae bacterium]